MPRSLPGRYSRPPLERMMEIHQLLAARRYPNASQLARKFEVTPRTIKRDLEFMRDRLALPIEYDARKRGHYYTQPVNQFPTLTVSQQELFGLLVAQKVVDAYQGTAFAAPLGAALKRLANLLDPSIQVTLDNLADAVSFRPLGPEDTPPETFEVLSRALQQRHEVSFLYRRLAEREWARRHVRPYHLAFIDHQWYLIGHDKQRKALRTFALSRMQKVHLLAQKFKPPQDFKVQDYLRDSFQVFKGYEDYEVVIEFAPWATDLLRGRRWNPRHEWIELPGGGSRLRLRLNNIEEILGWVLSWGSHAMVVRPKRLVARVREAAQQILEKYTDTTSAPE